MRPSTLIGFVSVAVLPLLGSQLQQDLGWTFTLPLVGLGLVAGIWAGVRTQHSQHLHRWGYPAMIIMYLALLLILTAVPGVPAIWAIVPPIALWAASVVLLTRSPDTNRHRDLVERPGIIVVLGAGLTALTSGVVALVKGQLLESSVLLGSGVGVVMWCVLYFVGQSVSGRVGNAAPSILLGLSVTCAVLTVEAGYGPIGYLMSGVLLTLGLALLLRFRILAGLILLCLTCFFYGALVAVITNGSDLAYVAAAGGFTAVCLAGSIGVLTSRPKISLTASSIGVGIWLIAYGASHLPGSLSPTFLGLGTAAVGYGDFQIRRTQSIGGLTGLAAALTTGVAVAGQLAAGWDVDWTISLGAIFLLAGGGLAIWIDDELFAAVFLQGGSLLFITYGVIALAAGKYGLAAAMIGAGLAFMAAVEYARRSHQLL